MIANYTITNRESLSVVYAAAAKTRSKPRFAAFELTRTFQGASIVSTRIRVWQIHKHLGYYIIITVRLKYRYGVVRALLFAVRVAVAF
jgi:hypothetical protein